MHYAFICEFGTLKFNLAQTKRQIYYRGDREKCYQKQLMPEEGRCCKINLISIQFFDVFEYANLGSELHFKTSALRIICSSPGKTLRRGSWDRERKESV